VASQREDLCEDLAGAAGRYQPEAGPALSEAARRWCEVLGNMARIAHIPATLIHGRHDVSGPLDTAWELHKAWPVSRPCSFSTALLYG
jgi:pimeloyl-ACP methyl ester carboxylesterase